MSMWRGADEVIDAAGGDPVEVDLHEHRLQRLVDAPAQARELGAILTALAAQAEQIGDVAD